MAVTRKDVRLLGVTGVAAKAMTAVYGLRIPQSLASPEMQVAMKRSFSSRVPTPTTLARHPGYELVEAAYAAQRGLSVEHAKILAAAVAIQATGPVPAAGAIAQQGWMEVAEIEYVVPDRMEGSVLAHEESGEESSMPLAYEAVCMAMEYAQVHREPLGGWGVPWTHDPGTYIHLFMYT